MPLSVKNLKDKLEQQGRRCALTGRLLSPDNCALDHIVPLDSGGGSDADNLQLVTKAVNAAKGTMGQREFIDMCIDVARKHGELVNVSSQA